MHTHACVCLNSGLSCSCSVVSDCVIPWTAALQAALSVGFSREEYWSGLSFPLPGDLPDQIPYHGATWEIHWFEYLFSISSSIYLQMESPSHRLVSTFKFLKHYQSVFHRGYRILYSCPQDMRDAGFSYVPSLSSDRFQLS